MKGVDDSLPPIWYAFEIFKAERNCPRPIK
jgi:hypothetical protein